MLKQISVNFTPYIYLPPCMHASSLTTTTTTMDIIVATTILAAFLLLVLLLPGRRRGKLPPGPRPWPILGNLPHLGPAPHQTLAAMATNYGPLLGLQLGSIPVVAATSARTAALFLKVHDAKFASRPPNAGSKHIAYNGQDLVFAPYGPRWRALRKICSLHLFSGKALSDFRLVREEEVAALVGSLLRRRADGGDQDVNVVNLSELLNVCTANALGRALMGWRVFEEVGGKDAGEFKEMVVEAMVLAGVFNIGDFIPVLDWFDLQGVVGKMKRLHRRFDVFLGRIVDEHRARCSHRHDDMLSVLMGIQSGDGHGADDGGWEGGLSDTEIKALLLVWTIELSSLYIQPGWNI